MILASISKVIDRDTRYSLNASSERRFCSAVQRVIDLPWTKDVPEVFEQPDPEYRSWTAKVNSFGMWKTTTLIPMTAESLSIIYNENKSNFEFKFDVVHDIMENCATTHTSFESG